MREGRFTRDDIAHYSKASKQMRMPSRYYESSNILRFSKNDDNALISSIITHEIFNHNFRSTKLVASHYDLLYR